MMITKEEAQEQAEAYSQANLPDLGPREWYAYQFEGGWLMAPQGPDLEWRIGVVQLILLDDGRVFRDQASLPPPWIADKYIAMLAREHSGAAITSPGDGPPWHDLGPSLKANE